MSKRIKQKIIQNFTILFVLQFFSVSVKNEGIPIAAEAKVSLVSNVYGISTDFIDCLLKTYFTVPRCVNIRDFFVVDSRKYAPDYFYSGKTYPTKVHFRVNALKVKNGTTLAGIGNAYVIQGESRLLQLPNVFSYLPIELCECPKFHSSLPADLCLEIASAANCPPFLEKKLEGLSECISPFMQTGMEPN